MTAFTDVRYMSADEKTKILADWKRFTASGFERQFFTKSLYDHFHLHCGHIAHFDIYGFYAEWFCDPARRLAFIIDFVNDHETGRLYMGAYSDYRDIGGALAEHMQPLVEPLTALAEHAKRENLRERIQRDQAALDALES